MIPNHDHDLSGPLAESVTVKDIDAAAERIASGIYRSPCPPSVPLSELTGCDVFCKLDLLQRTGSFKERGARNALLLLHESQKSLVSSQLQLEIMHSDSPIMGSS